MRQQPQSDFYEQHIHSLEQSLADLTIENQKLREDYSKLTKEQIDEINEDQLKEMAHWYGGFDELRKLIAKIEDNENEAAFERSQNEPGAWEG
jgi:hypothetical protein